MNEQEADFIRRIFGEKMMPDRWEKIQNILKSTDANVSLKTYSGVGWVGVGRCGGISQEITFALE